MLTQVAPGHTGTIARWPQLAAATVRELLTATYVTYASPVWKFRPGTAIAKFRPFQALANTAHASLDALTPYYRGGYI